jgi:hypothetical protein
VSSGTASARGSSALTSNEHSLHIFRLRSGRHAASCAAGDTGAECEDLEEAKDIVWSHVKMVCRAAVADALGAGGPA